MPIVGLTDRPAQFPEIGRIRKGAPKEPNKPGADLTYFRVEFDEKEPEALAEFIRHYGDKPDEIDILLPFDTVEENFEAWREAYLAGGMIHRCDGAFVVYAFDPQTGEVLVRNGKGNDGQAVACDGSSAVAFYEDRKGQKQPIYCKPRGRLKVILPILRRMAFLTILTGSIYDIVNLSSQLEGFRQVVGRLSGIPLVVRRRPREISRTTAEGQKVKITKSLLSIEADPRWVERKILAMQAGTVPMVDPSQILELPAPLSRATIEEDEEVTDIAESTEFPDVGKTPSPVPAEPTSEAKSKPIPRKWPSVYVEMALREGFAQNAPNVVGAMNLSPWADPETKICTVDDMKVWLQYYRGQRNRQLKADPRAAASEATEMYYDSQGKNGPI